MRIQEDSAWFTVFAGNKAIALYRKMGFEEMGRNLNTFKLKDGTYVDEINMIKFLH